MRWVSPNFHSVLECCRAWQNNLIAPDVQIFLCSVPEIDGHFAVAICNINSGCAGMISNPRFIVGRKVESSCQQI